MIFSNFVQDFKDWILQNISEDHFSDQRIINELNWASSYMYRTLNKRNVWWYSAVIETLTPDEDNTRRYTTTYRVSWIIEDVDDTNYDVKSYDWNTPASYSGWATKHTGVKADDTTFLKWKNLIFKADEGDFYRIEHSISWPNAILTSKEYASLEVRYKRLSKLYTVDDLKDNTLEVDMPEDLLGILQNIMFWRCFPKNFLENGFDIANSYLQQAREELEAYAQELAAQNQRFTA